MNLAGDLAWRDTAKLLLEGAAVQVGDGAAGYHTVTVREEGAQSGVKPHADGCSYEAGNEKRTSSCVGQGAGFDKAQEGIL